MTMTKEEYRYEIAEVHVLLKDWVERANDPYNNRSKLSDLMIDHDLIVKNYEKTLFSDELWNEVYGKINPKDEVKSEVAIEIMNARYFWNVIFQPVHDNLCKALKLLNQAADLIEKSLKENDSQKRKKAAKPKKKKDDSWNLMDACSNHGHWLD